MKLFKVIMLFLAGAFAISRAAGQANASINILTQNTGIINQGGTVFLQVTVNNTGPVSPIGYYKIKAQISVPSSIASIAATGHSLPAGWAITSSDSATIRLSNGTDSIAVNDARVILIAIKGKSLGGPLTIAGQLSFSNGNPPGTAPGVLAGDNAADNSSTSTIKVISTPVCNLSVTASASKISCNGGTATLTATVAGAAGTVEYSLNGGAFQPEKTFTVNAAGSPYTVTAREISNQACSATTASITVTQPVILKAYVSAGKIKCNGDTTTLTASAAGGTKPYQYSLNGGSFQTGKLFTVNAAGSPYTLTVKDAKNCIATAGPITVKQPSKIVITTVVDGFSTIKVTASGGTGAKAYAIATGPTLNNTGNTSGVFTGLSGGTYTFSVTDTNGCSATSAPVKLNIAPTVNITSPANNQTFVKGTNVHIEAAASDADGTINNVAFYNGTKLLITERKAPYDYNWVTDTVGNYTITARATDNSGRVTISAAIIITVVSNQPPTVSLISPSNGKTFKAPATINFEAAAQDADGTIAQVRFYNGKTLLADNERKAPYNYQWSKVPVGTYSITAVAKNNYGTETTSAPLKVIVTASGVTVASSRESANSKTDLNAEISLQLAPNPVSNILNITATGLQKDKRAFISVISSSGVLLKTLQTNSSLQTIPLNVSSLSSGMYIVKIACGDKVVYRQFIKL